MTTTVFSLATLAVTEFDTLTAGIDGDFEADSRGVYAQGGSEEVEASIEWEWSESNRKQRPTYLYVHASNIGNPTRGELRVSDSRGAAYRYDLSMVHNDVGRFALGRGIRDNSLTMAMTLNSTLPIVVDALEDERQVSQQRRL